MPAGDVDDDVLARAKSTASSEGRKDDDYSDYYSDYYGDEGGGGGGGAASGSNQYTPRSGSGAPSGQGSGSQPPTARSDGSGLGSQPATARSGGSYDKSASGGSASQAQSQSDAAGGTTQRSGYSGPASDAPYASGSAPATGRTASGSAPAYGESGEGSTQRSGPQGSEGAADNPTPRACGRYGESYYDKPSGDKGGGGGGKEGDKAYSEGYYSGYSGYYDYYSDENKDGKGSARSGYSGYSDYYDYSGAYSKGGGDDYYTYSGEGEGAGAYTDDYSAPADGARADDAASLGSEGAALVEAPLLGATGAAGAAGAAGASDGTHVGLGIQLQEPEAGEQAGAGFRVTRLIRGAPGDACGLICEGDVLVAIDGKSVVTTRFSAVSALLRGDEGTTISLEFERTVRERGELRTRAFEVTLRRARFLLPAVADDIDDAASEAPSEADGADGRARGQKAGYWEGYRAAMAQKAPPFAGSIASFDSSDRDDASVDGALPALPRSPLASDDDDDDLGPLGGGAAAGVEPETEQRLAGALAAGAAVGLPAPGVFAGAPSEEELAAEAAEEAAEEAAARAELAPGAAAWADRLGRWDGALQKAHEGALVKSELMGMWKLKLTAMRAKLGRDERVVAAQHEALARAPLPPSRASAARTAKVIESVQASGGKQTPSELLVELERQMVEAERWRAETQKLHALLRRSQAELGRKGEEMSKLRAQNLTWSTDSKQRRSDLQGKARELEELRAAHAALVSQATMWEERSNKLQDELKLKSELATMWKRSAEKAGAGDVAEVGAAALTWKVEAEKGAAEAARWKELARKAEETLDTKSEEALHFRTQFEASRLQLERVKEEKAYAVQDAGPAEEIQGALLAAQEDLNAKSEEAKQLRAKVDRLETAIRELM